LEHVKHGPDAKVIFYALQNFLQKYRFSVWYLEGTFVTFLSGGGLIILEQKGGISKIFLDFIDTVLHCVYHRPELSVYNALDEVADLNC
jgi:hypothetical protein